MKAYTPRAAKWLAIITCICAVALGSGITLIVAKISAIGGGLTLGGGLMGILFFCCFWAEKSRCLTIDANQIVLPRGADKNGKMSFQRTVINIDEIRSIEIKLREGIWWLNTQDTYFYTLKLKNGAKITFTLYAYGKNAEKEILETIKKSIRSAWID